MKEESTEEVKEIYPRAPSSSKEMAKMKARASVIREVVKPRAMNVVSTNMEEYLKSD